jgi:hypothetical protein
MTEKENVKKSTLTNPGNFHTIKLCKISGLSYENAWIV